MNGLGRLGQLYNLSPATLAGLAQIKGEQPPQMSQVPPQVSSGTGDENSPEAWAAAANAMGEPDGVRPVGPGQTYGDVQRASPSGDPGLTKFDESPHGIDPTTHTSVVQAKPAVEDDGPDGPSREAVGNGTAIPASPMRTVPDHWQPGTRSAAMHLGMAPEELQEGQIERELGFRHGTAAAQDRLEAAQQKGAADALYAGAHQMMAKHTNDQIAAINQRRDAYVATQKQKLEDLSAEAQKKEDPRAYFKEQGTFGSVLTGIMIGLGQFASMASGRGTNAALQIVNENIDRNIASQRANIANAHKAFDTASSLYDKNLAAFGDEERAALATKVQYLDQVAAMADVQRAQAGITDAEAMNHDFLKGIYDQRAKAADDFANKTHTQVTEQANEHFVPAQTVGGAPTTKREGNLVTLSDGTTFVMSSDKVADKAIDKIQVLDKLQRNNNEILQLRERVASMNPVTDMTDRDAAIGKLKDLGEEKVALSSLALGQGTLKEDEYARAIKFRAGILNGLEYGWDKPVAGPLRDSERKSTDDMLRAQSKRWGNDQRSFVTAAGGAVYERGYARDAAGQLKPVGKFTGQDAKPTEHLAPNGSKPMDRRLDYPTAGPKTSTTIPKAPRMDDLTPATKPAAGAGKGKRGGAEAHAPKPKKVR